MLKFHDVDQSDELTWLPLRVGKLTGSPMPKVMANYGKTFGDPAKRLIKTKAVEQITGKKSVIGDEYSNSHMQRGHEQEPIARQLYEYKTFSTITNGGFFEDGTLGCSPDGCVGDNGLIEIKSVIINIHYDNIKRANVDPAYKWQVYFNLMLTKRDWIDFVSYCADFPEETQLYIYRVYKEDVQEQFEMMRNRILEFNKEVNEAKRFILKQGKITWKTSK